MIKPGQNKHTNTHIYTYTYEIKNDQTQKIDVRHINWKGVDNL